MGQISGWVVTGEVARVLTTRQAGAMEGSCARKYRVWTEHEDKVLCGAVKEFPHGYGRWKRIAKEFDGTRTSTQCKARWQNICGLSKQPWTEAEISKFEAARVQYPQEWTKVAAAVGRNAKECVSCFVCCRPIWLILVCRCFRRSKRAKHKRGPFTTEEDALILEYVAQHRRPKWSKLSHTMNRHPALLRRRYRKLESKRLAALLDP